MSDAVLVVEDEATFARNLCAWLSRRGFEATAVASAEEALATIGQGAPDILVLDLHLPGMGGLEALRLFRERCPDAPVVILTAYGDIESAVEALRAGAADFLTKPVVMAELERRLRRLLEERRQASALDYYRRRDADRGGIDAILGDSQAMRRLREQIHTIVSREAAMADGTPPPVLITGETGTGKGLVARALHYAGPRCERPFVELNCAAIPPHLVESELFGHERGAFTDARERRAGLVETADGGTLFLDEIGDMPPEVQAKMLKLLEERRVRRLGSLREREVDVRMVAATNQDLEALVREGRFRADLLYRLRILHLHLPPLREHPEDILPLARHFLAEAARRYRRQGLHFAPEAEKALQAHPWPGNVRELRNLVERAVLLATGPGIGPADLGLGVARAEATASTVFRLPDEGLRLEELERDLVHQALARTGGNVTAAARLLGLGRDAMRYRVEKFGLDPARVRDTAQGRGGQA